MVNNYVSSAFTEKEIVEQEEGDLTFKVKDDNDQLKTFRIRGSVNKIEGKLLLPAPIINTAHVNPYMEINGSNIPISKKGSLWEVDILVVCKHNHEKALMNNDEEISSEMNVKHLRAFNINPLNAIGALPNPEQINEMAGLFIQVMHVRTGHFSSRILTNFFSQHGIKVSHSKVKSLVSNCKVCTLKTTHKKPKPKKKNVKTGKRVVFQPNKDDESSSSQSSDEEEHKINKRTFNHILYQDCIALPTSLQNNSKASVIIDYFSSFCSIYPITTANSKETAQHLLQWIERFGKPFAVQTDNGPEFDGSFEEVVKFISLRYNTL